MNHSCVTFNDDAYVVKEENYSFIPLPFIFSFGGVTVKKQKRVKKLGV